MKTVPVDARTWQVPGHKKPRFMFKTLAVGEARHYVGPDIRDRFKGAWYRWGNPGHSAGHRYSLYRTQTGVLVKREPNWQPQPHLWWASCFRDLRMFRSFRLDRFEPLETVAFLDTRFRMWSQLTKGERERWSQNLADRAERAVKYHAAQVLEQGRNHHAFRYSVRPAPEQLTPTVLIHRHAPPNFRSNQPTHERTETDAHDPLD